MTRDETLRALRRLRDGRDPLTGDVLPPDHLCQRADVVRVLFAAVQTIEASRGGGAPTVSEAVPSEPAGAPSGGGEAPLRPVRARPPHAGQPWTEDEDRRLAEAFDGGAAEKELAAEFGRSRASIRARLMRLGRGALLDDGPPPRYPVAGEVAAAAGAGTDSG
jgi:hypothetical protein